MRRRAIRLILLLTAGGCQAPTELLLRIAAPTNPLLDPFSLAVSDYALKSDDGATLAAVSAGAAADGSGRLSLGVLDRTLSGDLRLDVLSGAQLVGSSRLEGVGITTGKTVELAAEVRKPLVMIGADAAAEAPGPHKASGLLDPTTATDLVVRGVKVPEGGANGFTSDGRALLVAGPQGLTVIDTGTGLSTGPSALPFSPALLTLAPHDHALALVERATGGSRVLLYEDVGALVATPASAQGISAILQKGLPRAARFSPDGSMLYVLVEDAAAEPCTGTVPAANQIVPIDRTGRVGTPIALPSYAADFAVDRAGRLILAQPGNDQITAVTLASPDGSAGVGAPAKLYDAACPTALRLLEDQVFVVTNDTVASTSGFSLLHGRLDGSSPTRLPIARPIYETQLNATSTADNLTHLNLEFASTAIAATEMAVAPDGSRAVLATRARYRESKGRSFDFVGLTCAATVDIVEYGLYSIDLVAGTVSYTARSQNTVVPTDPMTIPCVSCAADLGGGIALTLDLFCPSMAGDRAAGLAAAFSGAP